MNAFQWLTRFAGLLPVLACAMGAGSCQAGAARQESASGFVIENDSELPDTYPYGRFEVRMLARGTLPLHWRVTFGQVPPGMILEDNGLLHGAAERAGDFQFEVSVTDSGVPQQTAHKSFVIHVRSEFKLEWKDKAHVEGNRIDGSVEVKNTTADDLDLTFVVLAVAENGRATAIGYQRFLLPRATLSKILPLGDTLPRGQYVVHVDAVAEVESKKLIFRHRLQSGPLQILVGP